MTFLNQCIEDSLPIWRACLETEFLKKMADGTLDEECLKGYIVDDSLYLREYAKVFAWGILHAKSMQEIREFYSLLAFVNESEDATRLRYIRRYGLTDEQIQSLLLRPENQAYVDAMVGAARDGEGAAECLAACLPCMLSYAWIFREMVRETPDVLNTAAGPLVADYASDGYAEVCRRWVEFTDEICREISDERRARCAEIFRECSEHERRFWLMSARKRDDL